MNIFSYYMNVLINYCTLQQYKNIIGYSDKCDSVSRIMQEVLNIY